MESLDNDTELIYEVQIAALTSEEGAPAELEKWASRGWSPYLVPSKDRFGQDVVTLRLGPYSSRAEAERVQQRVREDFGIVCVVRWRDRPVSP